MSENPVDPLEALSHIPIENWRHQLRESFANFPESMEGGIMANDIALFPWKSDPVVLAFTLKHGAESTDEDKSTFNGESSAIEGNG